MVQFHLTFDNSVNATTTAAEADEYGEYLTEQGGRNRFKVINTGTIDPYVSHWGRRPMRNQGIQYATPYLPSTALSDRRREMYASPKIIFAKLAGTCEAFMDEDGEYASLNTNCFHSPRADVGLAYVCGYCNSKVFMFIYERLFGALRMQGGYFQFQAPQLRVMPCPVASPREQSSFARKVRTVAGDLAADDPHRHERARTRMAELDLMYCRLLGLTQQETVFVCGADQAVEAALSSETMNTGRKRQPKSPKRAKPKRARAKAKKVKKKRNKPK